MFGSWQEIVHVKHCFRLNWEFIEWISQFFVCIDVLLLYFSFRHINFFWIYIDLFDSYVRFLFFVHYFGFSTEKGKSWDFLLYCSNSLLYRFHSSEIKQWKLFVQALDMHWFGWFLLNYLSGTWEAICHYGITHVISQIWFAFNLISNFS